MIVNIVLAASSQRTGGVTMVYEFANALARQGDEVHFLHLPAPGGHVGTVAEIGFAFDASVEHHIVETVEDPSLPPGDVFFGVGPPHLGQPASFVQGFRLMSAVWDAQVFRRPSPKICVASWLTEVGRWYGVPEHMLVHVPLGLDHDLFSARVPPEDRVLDVAVLYHPWKAKGWDVGLPVLERLAQLRPGLRGVVFSLAGPPPEPLPAGIELRLDLGQRALADEVLNATRVMLQTSHHEGFGLTAVEAMACGAALVTTDCGGSRDYARAGDTALVVEAGDVDALVGAADSLLSDPGRRNRLAAAGARDVRRFDWARSGARLHEFLGRYVAEPARYQQLPGDDRSEEYTL